MRRFSVTILLIVMSVFLFLNCVSQGSEITLELWHVWTGTRQPLLREVLNRFERNNPDIKVEDIVLDPSQFFEKVKVAWASGSGPDVAMNYLNELYGLAAFLQPLDPFIKADGKDLGQLIYPVVAEMIQYQGRTYYLPLLISTGNHLIYYNKEHFAEVGLDPNNPPRYHSEFQEAAKRLTRRGPDQRLERLGVNILGNSHSLRQLNLQAFVEQQGSGLYDKAMRTVLPDFELAVRTLEWMIDFAERTIGSAAESMTFGGNLQSGQHSIRLDQEHLYYQIVSSYPDFPVAIALLPQPDGQTTPRTRVHPSWGYNMSAHCKQTAEAWELIKWLAIEPDGAGWFVHQQNRLAASPRINQHPHNYSANPYWDVLMAATNYTVFNASQLVPGIDYTWARNLIGEAVEAAGKGTQDPRSALLVTRDRIQAVINEVLR
jgi:multiple sugar transport system substrate-binding protein